MSSKEKTMVLCRVALLAAAYFVLSITLTIKTPYLEITFKSLPVVVGALMFGPVGGGLVALFGELLAQMIGPYGLMPTTVLWLLPPPDPGPAAGRSGRRFLQAGQPSGEAAFDVLWGLSGGVHRHQLRDHRMPVAGQPDLSLL